METIRGEKRTYDEMMNEEPSTSHQVNEGALQMGRGDEDNERQFNVESVRQVNTKKFRTKAMNYRVQFINALADVEIPSLHEQLHEIFQQILDETIGGVPPQEQLRFVLHSNQLDKPIQKGDERGMTNTKMYTFLERNIVARTFPCLHTVYVRGCTYAGRGI